MKEKHIHKLKRYKYSTGNIIYFCSLPDCSYKVAPALAVGKRSICNRCGEPFIMNEYSIRLSKPHCTNCHEPKFPLSPPILVKTINFNESNSATKSLVERLKSVTITETEKEREEDESI